MDTSIIVAIIGLITGIISIILNLILRIRIVEIDSSAKRKLNRLNKGLESAEELMKESIAIQENE